MMGERKKALGRTFLTATACWLTFSPLTAQDLAVDTNVAQAEAIRVTRGEWAAHAQAGLTQAQDGIAPEEQTVLVQARPSMRPSTQLRPMARQEPPLVEADVQPIAPPQIATDKAPLPFARVARPRLQEGTTLPPAPPLLVHTSPLPAEATEPPKKTALPELRSSGFSARSYAEDRAIREAAFVAATAPEDKISRAMDVAQLFVAHMLLPESRDYLRVSQGLGVSLYPELNARWQGLNMMQQVLSQAELPAEFTNNWEMSELWRLVNNPQLAKSGANLPAAIAELQFHSQSVVTEVLPRLFDAALLANDLRSADTLMRGAREATSLSNEPVMNYMLGRLALAYDMPQDAFDYFAKAADGRDIFAQRARIALADLALARQNPKLLPALADILKEGVNQWRHGREALILRARLAQVAEDLGDIPLALDIMGKIRTDHPGTAEAILAHERGALALAAFAVAVDSDEIGLTTYLDTLRKVEPFYRLDPIWPIARTALANAWSRSGLHVAAAAELAALQDVLERIGTPEPQPKIKAEIPVAEAEQWISNHELAKARLALARDGLPSFSDLSERYTKAAIQAQALGAYSQPMQFSDLEGFEIYARGARMAGLFGQAHEANKALAARGALSNDLANALQAIVLAYDLSETEFADQAYTALQATPAGQASAAQPALNDALKLPMPDLSLLAMDTANVMLERSDMALDATRSLLNRTSPNALPLDASPAPNTP